LLEQTSVGIPIGGEVEVKVEITDSTRRLRLQVPGYLLFAFFAKRREF
jgi:hypothetical protein